MEQHDTEMVRMGTALSSPSTERAARMPKRGSSGSNTKTEPDALRCRAERSRHFLYLRPRGNVSILAAAVIFLLGVVLIACMMTQGGEAPKESENGTETTPPTPDRMDLYHFDPTLVPSGHVAFRPMDLSGSSLSLQNQTSFTPDPSALLASYRSEAEVDPSSPLVLIVHTHGSEAYSEEGALSHSGKGEFARSTDHTKNVVAVGAVLCETLNRAGIPTLHATLLHDTVNGVGAYEGSYARAAETISSYLSAYPSIRYVIDLHRDAVFDGDGNAVRAVTEVSGAPVAQVMAVVGSSENGTNFPWEPNLSLALALSEELNRDASVARSPMLRASSYNQELAPVSLLLEIGTAANSLKEAKNAAVLVGNALAMLILSDAAGE